ncbi:MAG TPA: hypothetical protein PKX48_15025 [Planctomycetota bacterium]|jgi:hypothetical protein|nr:hypothetical protein [Planctomycetota bacterium]OQC20122.1 MAG: hypothetical protein BWX69_02155 [Planctomycetes bacterium ADurb.Bin069]HNS00636.1 hypothetical protein [Planctomycetota bacterium]HNU26915.1 hypothetical protein [Planctomycetota bacterium]HOE30722.1 hypothetical protein [Planctomycetota bacterium]
MAGPEPRSAGARRGAMLIIALMFLTLLTMLGVTFAALMKLEREATRNYLDGQTGDLVLHSAVDAAAAQLYGAMNFYHFTSCRAPWLFKDPKGDEMGAGVYKLEEVSPENLFFSGVVEPVKGVARCFYKAKVLDCASQININVGTDNLAMMLDSLGEAIQITQGVNPLFSGKRRVRGDEIVRLRHKQEKGQFASKSQLSDLLGEENFERLADFITTHSWVDTSTGKPQDTVELVLQVERTGRLSPRMGGIRYEETGHAHIWGSKTLSAEPRSPININTAPEEVLIACFTGLACGRPFPYIERQAMRIGEQELRSGFAPEGNDRFPQGARGAGGGQEETNYTIRPVWVYTPRIELQQARIIAKAIMSERKRTPFIAWETGRASGGGFAEFVNTRLGEPHLPRANQVMAIDPLNPRLTTYQSVLSSGGGANPAVANIWGPGHENSERAIRNQRGLPYHGRNRWYFETVKAGIIANFNPNARLNRGGANVGATLVVDKTALVSPWVPRGFRTAGSGMYSRSELYGAYTTEFCFDTGGHYEITALAQLDARFDPTQHLSQPKRFRKARAIVKVFETLQHTTQYDFEKQFYTGRYSSRRGQTNGRRYVMTHPQPVIAATDYITSGSAVDGSVQLMGHMDAQKVVMQSSSRDSFYRPMQNILFAHSFMFRQSQDEERFFRLVRSGHNVNRAAQFEGDEQVMGRQSEYDILFQSVLDADFVRGQREFRERYNMDPLRQGANAVIAGDGGSLSRVVQWPRLSEQALEFGNLRPEGLHTNIFNATTRGAGMAMFPASSIATRGVNWGVGRHEGGAFSTSGAMGQGNVHYYEGGVAFWIRFDFDANDPIFCGLVGCTQVVSDLGPGPRDSEGNQFYIFKSSFGELRVVRMYYHRAFGLPSMHGTNRLLPEIKAEGLRGGGAEEGQDLELDVHKAYARSEVVVDISGWKKDEWHHVAVYWNDLDQSDQRVQVFIDLQAAQAATAVTTGLVGQGRACNLNVKVPYDELTIGGIVRRQAVPDAGLFKFAYNLTGSKSRTGAGGLGAGAGGIGSFSEPWKKVFPANATIDEFVSFSGPFDGYRTSVLGNTRSYFTRYTGVYHNQFEITLPQGVEVVKLRSFTWTEYQPTMFHGPVRGTVWPLDTQPCRAKVYLDTLEVNFQRPPWLETGAVSKNQLAGRLLHRPTGRGVAEDSVKVGYRFDLTPARGRGGNLSGVALATPILDDVTLTYFLPSTQILLWEDLPVDYEALAGAKAQRRSRSPGQ